MDSLQGLSVALNVKLHPNQQTICNDKSLFKVIKAGKRFGKTYWAIYELLRHAGLKTGLYWYVAPTYGMAESIAWNVLIEMLPSRLIAKKRVDKLTIILTNGSVIRLLGADNQDALRGTRIDGLIMDEVAYTDEYCWTGILRGQLIGEKGSGFAYFISSPPKSGRNWYSDFWNKAKSRMEQNDKNWSAYYYTIHDNPLLDKEFVKSLQEDTPEDTWNLEYLALDSALSGLIYKEFDQLKHVKPFEVKPEWKLIRALDWGIAHPTVCLFMYVDEANRHVYIRNVFKKSGLVIQESCEAIKQITGNREVYSSVIDPSTAKRNSQTGRRDMDEFARFGVFCSPADNRDRGYDITKMFFKKNCITIHTECKELIFELRALQYGDKEGDDVCDSLRYGTVKIHDTLLPEIRNEEVKEQPKTDGKLVLSLFDKNLFPQKMDSTNMQEFLLHEVA